MITDIFRLDDNVPRIYVEESRDFQMLCRLFTIALNAPKYEVETLHYLNSGVLTNDRLLGQLCEKTSFMDGESAKGEMLRYITENFATLVRDKGAEVGILNSVYLYLLMYNLSTSVFLQIDKDKFIVRIGIKSTVRDIDILYTILKYIVPIGWIIDIFFYAEMKIVQGFYYKDTLVHMIKRASARNALYIIETNRYSGSSSEGGDPLTPPLIGDSDSMNYKKFGVPFSGAYKMDDNPHSSTYNTHITKYTGSLAINSMSSDALATLAEEPSRLRQYGVELWDAQGYIRQGKFDYDE